MKTKRDNRTMRQSDNRKGGGVVLTVRQARLLLSVANAYAAVHGLTPMERLLVGAVRLRLRKATTPGQGRVEKARKDNRTIRKSDNRKGR